MVRPGLALSFLLAALLPPALAAPRSRVASTMQQGRGALATSEVRPLAAPEEAKADMARYSLKAYENVDEKNPLKGLLFTPKPMGTRPLPMVVYIPGNGELGDVSRQFRQKAIFERVASRAFQERHPCFLLALSPPQTATTLLGGMPGSPTPMQRAIREFVAEVCRTQRRPRVDTDRLYLTGFSYGGNGAYALAQHYPGDFAAVVPIAALPPRQEYFAGDRPGNWWHFCNEGDYLRRGLGMGGVEAFAALVRAAGGDFRIGTYPSSGHDAWTKAWREDAVWDWMFSKSLKGAAKATSGGSSAGAPIGAKCTASVPGRDAGHGPERAADGLDATWYLPARAFAEDDWWQIEFPAPVKGTVRVLSGDGRGAMSLRSGIVECSRDGRRWSKAGVFSRRDGACTFELRSAARFLRVRSTAQDGRGFCLRRIDVAPESRR